MLLIYVALLSLLGAVAGLWLSFSADLPVGATVVSVFGLLPLLAVGLRMTRPSRG